MIPAPLPFRQLLLRIALALAICLNGFLAPLAMAFGGHATSQHAAAISHDGCPGHAGHHDDAADARPGDARGPHGCCGGINCDCGCMMHVGRPMAPLSIATDPVPMSLVVFQAPALVSALQLPSLRPPIA